MNILVPDIKTLEKITGIQINDLAEMVKAAYIMMTNNKSKAEMDESSNKFIIFSFKDPKDFNLKNINDGFPTIETFISCLGQLSANFDILNTLDDNDESKVLSIDFIVQRTALKK